MFLDRRGRRPPTHLTPSQTQAGQPLTLPGLPISHRPVTQAERLRRSPGWPPHGSLSAAHTCLGVAIPGQTTEHSRGSRDHFRERQRTGASEQDRRGQTWAGTLNPREDGTLASGSCPSA